MLSGWLAGLGTKSEDTACTSSGNWRAKIFRREEGKTWTRRKRPEGGRVLCIRLPQMQNPQSLQGEREKAMKHRLAEIRKGIVKIPKNEVLVGWFTKEVDSIGESFLARVSDVFVVMLGWDHDRVFSQFKTPITMTVMPVLWHARKAFIGGLGWQRTGAWPEKVRYLPPNSEEKGSPVGWFYAVSDESGGPYSPDNKKGSILRRAFEAAADLLRWNEEEASPIGDRKIGMPVIMSSRTQRTHLKLRESQALDEQVLGCATSGLWPFPARSDDVSSMCRGTFMTKGSELRITPEDDKTVEHVIDKTSAESLLEIAIRHNFGEVVRVNLDFALEQQAGYVQLGQPLFRPIEKKDWTLEELKARKDWKVLASLGALATARNYAGAMLLDVDLVESNIEPWIDGRYFPMRTRVINRQSALKEVTPCGEIDLYNFSLRKMAHKRLSYPTIYHEAKPKS